MSATYRGTSTGSNIRARVQRFFTLQPFHVLNAEGRSHERYRRIALTSLGSVGARVLSTATSLISISLVARYLNPELFGLWLTIGSLLALLTFADLGLGNGLMTAVAKAYGEDDETAIRTHVSSAFFSLLALAVIAGAIFAVIHPFVRWHELLNISSPRAVDQVGPAVVALALSVLAGLPLSVAHRVQWGCQEGFKATTWNAAGSVAGFLGAIGVVVANGDAVWLVLALAGAPTFGLLLNTVALFGVQRRSWRPRLGEVNRGSAGFVVRAGFLFFVLQLAGAVAYQSDSVVIAALLGAEHVPSYALPLKLFLLGPTFIGLGLAALWPAYTESLARGDLAWVRKTFRRSLLISTALTLALSLLLIALGDHLIKIWADPVALPSTPLLLLMGLWAIEMGVSGPFAMFLNGANVVRFQIVIALSMSVANIVLSVVLVQRIGVAGAVLGSVVSQLIFVLIPAAIYIYRKLHEIEAEYRNPRVQALTAVSTALAND